MTSAVRSVAVVTVFLLSCSSPSGDPHSSTEPPTPQGKDLRIAQVNNPDLPEHAGYLAADAVTVSGAAVVAVDTFDETTNGKSVGTIYVQDLGSQSPFSGTSLFAPSFVPGNLRVGAGDVLDLHGPFQENASIGTAIFAPGSVLPQLARPTATFRLELGDEQKPVDIDPQDLADYKTGRQWLNMLVRVKNPKVLGDVSKAKEVNGRLSIGILPKQPGEANGCNTPFPKAPTLANELADIGALEIKQNTPIKSITGVVTFFCNFHLSPRRASDIEK